MNNLLIKEGQFTIILGEGHFSKFLKHENIQLNPLIYKKDDLINDSDDFTNKLMKISYINDFHSDYILKEIKKINNYKIYFSLPNSKKTDIPNSSLLYSFISNLDFNDEIHPIIKKNFNLYYSLINNEGDYDLQEIFQKIYDYGDISIWEDKPKKKIICFIRQLLEAVDFLHKNKIVHLDIKPENIMYNQLISNFSKRFKLIDFGFADKEPFNHSLDKPKGTLGYTPTYYFSNNERWLPTLHPNDWENGKHISLFNQGDKRFLIYKSDIFSLGRVIFYLDHLLNNQFLNQYKNDKWFCYKKKRYKKLYDNIYINSLTFYMTEEKIEKRYDIDLCFKFLNLTLL
jgi:serine/threonine protein kinase